MISADKQQMLSGFLCKLPETVASRLAKPFEDLLVVRERHTKQKGRIARSSIEPVWNWLANELMPARHRELTDAIRDAILYSRLSDIEQRAVEFWAESATALKPALADEKKMTAAAKKLGGVAAAEDAAEIALLLRGAPEIEKLRNRLPKPIVGLADEDIAFLRDAYDRLTASDPDLAPYVPLVVLGRLEKPWEVLRVVVALTRKSTDTLISKTDLAVVGDLLFSDLDVHVKKIQAVRAV